MSQSGIIFDVKRFAVHDGPGIRTTVFFKGCPLDCQWCHNPESRRYRPEVLPMNGYHRCARWLRPDEPGVVGKEVTADRCLSEIEKDVIFYDQSGGGVTFSGGEPLMQPAFLGALLSGCRSRNIQTAIDTSGHAAWSDIEPLLPDVDLFLYDLKIVDDEQHRLRTGVSNDQIIDNLRRLHDARARVIIRIPLIPGITDTTTNLTDIRSLVDSMDGLTEVHLLPYNTIARDKYRRFGKADPVGALEKQSPEALQEIQTLFATHDLDVKIGG
jgi:pyruvate formate lyase activating enzyme